MFQAHELSKPTDSESYRTWIALLLLFRKLVLLGSVTRAGIARCRVPFVVFVLWSFVPLTFQSHATCLNYTRFFLHLHRGVRMWRFSRFAPIHSAPFFCLPQSLPSFPPVSRFPFPFSLFLRSLLFDPAMQPLAVVPSTCIVSRGEKKIKHVKQKTQRTKNERGVGEARPSRKTTMHETCGHVHGGQQTKR